MKLYFKFFKIHLKSIMQYKVSFILTAVGQFLISFTSFLGLYFLLEKFQKVQGFTYDEVLLAYAAILMGYAIAECFAYGFKNFSQTISNGQFDRMMIRPKSTLFLVLTSKMEFSSIGKMAQAVVILIYALCRSTVVWTAEKVLVYIGMIAGAVLVFMGLYIIYATLCFFTVEGLEFMSIFTDGGKEFGKYPFGIYGEKILKIFTFFVPLACAQYYPLLYLTEKTEHSLLALTPLTTVVFVMICCFFWQIGVKNYKSTGS